MIGKFIRSWKEGGREAKTTTTYYVSGSGRDDNDGRHPLRAWKTIGRLNDAKAQIKVNDQILFQRGFSYPGRPFYLASTRHLKIMVGAFGSGAYPKFPDLSESDLNRGLK